MDTNITSTIATVSILAAQALIPGLPGLAPKEQVLSHKQISMENRYGAPSVNEIYKDNILLNIAYLKGVVSDPKNINWEEVRKPFKYEFKLEPGQTFAFHEDILPEYQGKVIKTTNTHFGAGEGYKFSGRYFGDGVCHLASLMYWVALDAGLDSIAPTSHDFAEIPEIAKEYGVSIYADPRSTGAHAKQNLYVTNNKGNPVMFRFEYANNQLKLTVAEAVQ